jgi:predicted nucleic acid-binding protein
MTGRVFVDANVLLYARDADEPAKRPRAAAWLAYLWRTELGRTSVQVLSEYYVNVKRSNGIGLDPAEAWEDVKAYLAWRPLAVDDTLLMRAREVEQRFRISWWDSMVVAAAQAQDCRFLLTEDLHDGGVFGMVTVRSPFTLDVGEPGSDYELALRRPSPHRPRGRPRRKAPEAARARV